MGASGTAGGPIQLCVTSSGRWVAQQSGFSCGCARGSGARFGLKPRRRGLSKAHVYTGGLTEMHNHLGQMKTRLASNPDFTHMTFSRCVTTALALHGKRGLSKAGLSGDELQVWPRVVRRKSMQQRTSSPDGWSA